MSDESSSRAERSGLERVKVQAARARPAESEGSRPVRGGSEGRNAGEERTELVFCEARPSRLAAAVPAPPRPRQVPSGHALDDWQRFGHSTRLVCHIQGNSSREQNLAELAERYKNRIRTWCQRELRDGNQRLIEDAISNAWCRILEKINTFDRSKGSFAAWCSAVTRNTTITLLRELGRCRERAAGGDTPVTLQQLLSREKDPSEEPTLGELDKDQARFLLKQAKARVEPCIDPLSLRAYRMRYEIAEPMKLREIAEVLGRSIPWVSTHTKAVRDALRAMVERLMQEGLGSEEEGQ